jgi:hypothetical protein
MVRHGCGLTVVGGGSGRKMRSPTEYADHIELRALSRMLNVRLTVFSHSPGMSLLVPYTVEPQEGGDAATRDPPLEVFLILYQEHYDLLQLD